MDIYYLYNEIKFHIHDIDTFHKVDLNVIIMKKKNCSYALAQ